VKKALIILLVVVAVLAAGGFIAYQIANSSLKNLSKVPVSDVDMSKIADGTYVGSYSSFPVVAEVSVTLKNHVITNIDLVKHQNGQGGGAERIPGQVIETQSLQIDAVSGATYSSKVILKAIEDALLSAT
jgi:uncharacterized protein with FMN-binding domain